MYLFAFLGVAHLSLILAFPLSSLFCFVENPWSLWIWTSDMRGAGTDAPIYLQIFGDKGKSDEMKLDNNSDNFEAGQMDKFMVWLPSLQNAYIFHKQSFVPLST